MGRGGDAAVERSSGLFAGRRRRRNLVLTPELWASSSPPNELRIQLEQMDTSQLLELLDSQRQQLAEKGVPAPLLRRALEIVGEKAASASPIYADAGLDPDADPDEHAFLSDAAASKLRRSVASGDAAAVPAVGFAELLRRQGAPGLCTQQVIAAVSDLRLGLTDQVSEFMTPATIESMFEQDPDRPAQAAKEFDGAMADWLCGQLARETGELFKGFGEDPAVSSEVVREYSLSGDNAWKLHLRGSSRDDQTLCGKTIPMKAGRAEWAIARRESDPARPRQTRSYRCDVCADAGSPTLDTDRIDWVLGVTEEKALEMRASCSGALHKAYGKKEPANPTQFRRSLERFLRKTAINRFAEEVERGHIDPLHGLGAYQGSAEWLRDPLVRGKLHHKLANSVLARRRVADGYLRDGRAGQLEACVKLVAE